jgi:CheY-like chemotaxis protein
MPEKILVVDDDVDTLRLVGLMLQRQGYLIVAASNGHQALALAQSENPDLILLDVMMPDMDGYEVTKRLRLESVTATTPIIMFTAKSQLDDKVAGFESGVDDYLTKPTQPRELFAHVKAVLARSTKGHPAVVETTLREKGYVIGVLSVKGGLGVSTLVMNLGVSLRMRTRKDVIVAELRPGEGSLALDLGYLHPEGLDRLLNRAKPSEIAIGDVETELIAHRSEVRLLLASYRPSDAKFLSQAEKLETITRHLAHLGDFIVLDLGPALPPTTEKILSVCDELIIVLEPVPNTLVRTQLLMDELAARGFGEGRVNAVLYNRARSELQLSLSQVQQQFKQNILVVFTPAPELALQTAKSNIPIVIQHPDNLVSQQFAKLADSIVKHLPSKT